MRERARRTDFGRYGFVARGRSLVVREINAGLPGALQFPMGLVTAHGVVARADYRRGRIWCVS